MNSQTLILQTFVDMSYLSYKSSEMQNRNKSRNKSRNNPIIQLEKHDIIKFVGHNSSIFNITNWNGYLCSSTTSDASIIKWNHDGTSLNVFPLEGIVKALYSYNGCLYAACDKQQNIHVWKPDGSHQLLDTNGSEPANCICVWKNELFYGAGMDVYSINKKLPVYNCESRIRHLCVWKDSLVGRCESGIIRWESSVSLTIQGYYSSFCAWDKVLVTVSREKLQSVDWNGKCVTNFIGHEATIWSIYAFDGHLYSGSSDHTLRKWDSTGQCLRIYALQNVSWFFISEWNNILCSGGTLNTLVAWKGNFYLI